MNPEEVDVPEEIHSERLVLRAPDPAYAAEIVAAVEESIDDLRPWLPWAQRVPTLEFQLDWTRQTRERFRAKSECPYFLFERETGLLVGATGMVSLDWSVPKFEIGYWVRSSRRGRGYITEAVDTLTRLAFTKLGARRVEIRCSSLNRRSAAVAERLGFDLEGVLRNDGLHPDGSLRDTLLYARVEAP